MRSIIRASVVGVMLSTGLVLGSGIAAHAGGACTDPTQSGQITDAAGNSGVQVCTPAGSLTVAGNQAAPSGYVIASGADTNPGAGAGFIGVEGGASGVSVVGCSSGSYLTTDPAQPTGTPDDESSSTDANGNNVLITVGPGGPSQVSSVPPSGPCAPSAP